MNWRAQLATLMEGLTNPDTGEVSENIKMLSIASAFLIITVGLILFQPGLTQEEIAAAQTSEFELAPEFDLASQPIAAKREEFAQQEEEVAPQPDTAVTRFDSDFFGVTSSQDDEATSFEAQLPLSPGTPAWFDLHALTGTVLADFGHVARPGDQLHQILVQAVAERQSDDYIDALLNTAAARGAFSVPLSLLNANGRLETETLLLAIRARSRL